MPLTKIIGSGIGTVTNQFSDANMASGSVLQVQTVNHKGEISTTSNSMTAVTDLAITLTPTSTSSKVLLMFQAYTYVVTYTRYFTMSVTRNVGGAGATDISGTTINTDNNGDGMFRIYDADSHSTFMNRGFNFLDSPNTTSSTVYTPTFRRGSSSATCYIGHSNIISTFTAIEVSG